MGHRVPALLIHFSCVSLATWGKALRGGGALKLVSTVSHEQSMRASGGDQPQMMGKASNGVVHTTNRTVIMPERGTRLLAELRTSSSSPSPS
ncbi:hypothetical protein RB195_007001 [Necator americanus]|uniref:Secreted protein n=1 Tax=Necator americanus TaxID=51031 RepID=A0ABR1BVA3_NECAM